MVEDGGWKPGWPQARSVAQPALIAKRMRKLPSPVRNLTGWRVKPDPRQSERGDSLSRLQLRR